VFVYFNVPIVKARCLFALTAIAATFIASPVPWVLENDPPKQRVNAIKKPKKVNANMLKDKKDIVITKNV